MKHVFYKIKERGVGFYLISYWTKPGNELSFKTVILDEEKIHRRIADITGSSRFTLEFVNDKMPVKKNYTTEG